MSSPPNSVPDTQLGLTNDEIALLRHHQQAAASGTSSSGIASQASSQGLLLLDSHSLVQLSRHFDQLLQQINARVDYLSEQSKLMPPQQYDQVGNPILVADSEIARMKDIVRQIDELEVDFDRVRHIRNIVKGWRQRVEEMEESLQVNTSRRRTPSHRHHGEVKTEHRTVPSHSTQPIQEESDARHPTVGQLAAEKAKAEKVKIDTPEHERQLRRDEREKKRAEAEIKVVAKVAEEKHAKTIIELQCESCTHNPFRSDDALKKHREEKHDQLFFCTFSFAGCQEKFAYKKDWKRHVLSQHGDQSQERSEVSLLSTENPGPFSDSGYASMGLNQAVNTEDVGDETRTICTDGQELNIEDEVKRKLVDAFSRETIQHLHSTLVKLDSNGLNMKPIVELLKEFSIRLQFSAKPGQQKDTAVFVRHCR